MLLVTVSIYDFDVTTPLVLTCQYTQNFDGRYRGPLLSMREPNISRTRRLNNVPLPLCTKGSTESFSSGNSKRNKTVVKASRALD